MADHHEILSEKNRECETTVSINHPDYYQAGTAHGEIKFYTRLHRNGTITVSLTVHGERFKLVSANTFEITPGALGISEDRRIPE